MHPATIEQGFIIGKRYRVLECFGVGEASEMYRAMDIGSGRGVVVKRFAPGSVHLTQPGAFGPLVRAAHRIGHPGVVPVQEAGHSEVGPFYVRPDISSDSLARLMMREGALAPRLAAFLLSEILWVIESAHERGIYHLNLKPENVLISRTRERVEVHVVDFLGSTLFQARVEGHPSSLNSPHYMAPEQLLRKQGLSAPADIFAAGAMLFELLTGERPFGHGSSEAVAQRVLEQPLLRARAQAKIDNRELSATVLKALDRATDQRFVSAAEFAAQLRDHFEGHERSGEELLALVPSLVPASRGPARRPMRSSRPSMRPRSGPAPVRGARPSRDPVSVSGRSIGRVSARLAEPMARGVVLRVIDAYVLRAFDAEAHDNILGELRHHHPEYLAPSMLQGIVPYPLGLANDYCELVTQTLCAGNPMWARRAGEDAVGRELAVFVRDALKPAPLQTTLRRLSLVFARFFLTTEWEVVSHSPHAAQLCSRNAGELRHELCQWVLGIVRAVASQSAGRIQAAVTSTEPDAAYLCISVSQL